MPQVIIRHDKTGVEYGIDSSDFRRGKHYQMPDGEMATFADAGFRVVSNIDGTEYHGPLTEDEPRPTAAPRRSMAEPAKDAEA